MAGIKNHIQTFGLALGKGFGEIEDPMKRHMAFMKQQATPYCKGCGKQLLDAVQDESGATVNYEEEQKRQMCTKCYNERLDVLRKLQAEVEKKKTAENWEEMKKRYIKE